MGYKGGGKLWVEPKGLGWVALERDWEEDLLPQDLVAEAGILGGGFQVAEPYTRASLGGYVKVNSKWMFFFSDESIDFHGIKDEKLFLLGDCNDWQISSRWELSPGKGGMELWVEDEALSKFEEFEFKFCTEKGRWIDPHNNFPAFPVSEGKFRNAWFHKNRTGKDLIEFKVIEPRGIKGSEKWISYRPEGSFGFSFDGEYSSFRIFAPRAEGIELLLFEKTADIISQKIPMLPKEDGSWCVTLQASLLGVLYKFSITQLDAQSNLFSKEIVDPYARAMVGRNGPGLALVPEFKPQGKAFNPPSIEDAVVVEVHIRDLLANAPCTLSQEERLGFKGLTKWLASKDCYLRKLGANVVELQPVHEFDARTKEQYHWGYMPVNFFSPASVYSSCSKNEASLTEFRQLVDAFHDAGMAVVLDVVYNHIGIPQHLINLDREIYCSTDNTGNLTNHSGCGNDLRCESEPVKKLIIDSLVYWIEVFDVDGFRFDLGELLGLELLTEIENELKKIKPGILLFAEPWSFRGRLPAEMNETSYSLWNDASREGWLSYAKNQSGKDLAINLLNDHSENQNYRSYQSLNYLESHDDYALVDRFRDLGDWGEDDSLPEEVVHRVMLALGMLMAAPGVPMLSAGQDFLRHKQGIRNTYLNGDINALSYESLLVFEKEALFVRKLIEIRLSGAGHRSRYPHSDEWTLHSFPVFSESAICYGWEHKETEEKFWISANPSQEIASIELPESWSSGAQQLAAYGFESFDPNVINPLSFYWAGNIPASKDSKKS